MTQQYLGLNQSQFEVGGENCVALCVTLVIVENREVVAQSSRALYMTAHSWLCDLDQNQLDIRGNLS